MHNFQKHTFVSKFHRTFTSLLPFTKETSHPFRKQASAHKARPSLSSLSCICMHAQISGTYKKKIKPLITFIKQGQKV